MGLREAGGHQQWVVGAFLETHCDVPFGGHHVRDRIDEVAEDVLGLGGRVAIADPLAKQSIQAAGHERQLKIATDLHRHAVGDAVFDEHALRVSSDEVHGHATQLVGQYEGGFFVPRIGHDDLPLAAAAHRVAWLDLQNGLAWATEAGRRAQGRRPRSRAESVLRELYGRELLSAGSSAMMYRHCRAIMYEGLDATH
jgi:hypothetical protein